MGLIKSCIFGGITALCGCYFGYYTKGGAVGVGCTKTELEEDEVVVVLL